MRLKNRIFIKFFLLSAKMTARREIRTKVRISILLLPEEGGVCRLIVFP